MVDMNELMAAFSGSSTSGKGKKQCPACNEYVGVRTKLCSCGHEFVPGAKKDVKPPRETTIFTSTGRGRKQCPECKTIVGVRTINCPKCNHTFKKGSGSSKPKVRVTEQVVEVDPLSVEARRFAAMYGTYGNRVLFAVPGPPLVKFNGDLDDWIPKVLDAFDREYGGVPAKMALKKMIGVVYDPNTKQYVRYTQLLDEKVKEAQNDC